MRTTLGVLGYEKYLWLLNLQTCGGCRASRQRLITHLKDCKYSLLMSYLNFLSMTY